MKKIFFSIVFVLPMCSLLAQINIKNTIDTIPFTLTSHNNIVVAAIMNEVDTLQLMLHTATDMITLTEAATERIQSLKFEAPDSIKTWGGDARARFSYNNSLKMGKLSWDSLALLENKRSGPTTDGKFGFHLFKDKIVEINYDFNIIVLHNNLPAVKTYEKLAIEINGSMLFVEGTCMPDTSTLTKQFLIHSGYAGTLLLDDETVKTHQLGEILETISESELKDAYGNVLKTKKALMPLFTIQNQHLENLPIGFFEGSIGRQKMCVLGGDILKRFNLIFDIQASTIYLKSNTNAGLTYFEK